MTRRLYLLVIALISSLHTFAQSTGEIDMADAWRANGKINVVIAVLAVIFLGLFIYLIGIDRKLRRLESKKGS